MKRYFFVGLFILLPFVLTLIIVGFIVNLLTAPFENIVAAILSYYDVLDNPFLFLSDTQMLHIFSKILVLMTLFGFILLIGFFGHMLLLTSIIQLGEVLIRRIPMVNTIYKAIKEIVKTFFNNQANTFSQVALVPFPHPKSYSIGLVSLDKLSEGCETINVFIPTTPNPTIGYMLAFKPSELIFIDMKVDDAIKCIVSCGIMFPEFKIDPASSLPKEVAEI